MASRCIAERWEVQSLVRHPVTSCAVNEDKPETVAVLSTPKTNWRAFCARH